MTCVDKINCAVNKESCIERFAYTYIVQKVAEGSYTPEPPL